MIFYWMICNKKIEKIKFKDLRSKIYRKQNEQDEYWRYYCD